MASKAVKVVGKRKTAAKVIVDPILRTYIRAQMATAAPPLGPDLGQRGVNVANFCKDFNRVTEHINPGTLLPVKVLVKPDRTYDLEISTPKTTWLLHRAAGIRRDAQNPDEIAGKVTVKHVYEIAKVKSQDKWYVGVPLKDLCQMVINKARAIGIEVQNADLDPIELKTFLDERREIVAAQLQEIADKEAAKMLRT